MTFIASVVAKKGVAIIADSLVTSSKNVIDYERFLEYVGSKQSESETEIKLDLKEIVELFEIKPSHTKDYEEKLFQYDRYTAITTAGAANINNKRIEQIVSDAKIKFDTLNDSNAKDFQAKFQEFKDYLISEIKEHLRKHTSIRRTVFIITNYSKSDNKTTIHRIEVAPASSKVLEEANYEYIKVTKQPEQYKVVCDGQNRISERILFGEMFTLVQILPKIVNKIAADFNITALEKNIPYISSLMQDETIFIGARNDMKMFKLTDLSIQQAVDLACLLMRIEIDIQKYTETIPTVGGVVKVAIIDSEGFKHVSGHEIRGHI